MKSKKLKNHFGLSKHKRNGIKRESKMRNQKYIGSKWDFRKGKIPYFSKGLRVLGMTSFVAGDVRDLKNSYHIFMNEFDGYDYYDVKDEAKYIHKKFGIDLFIARSSNVLKDRSIGNFHVLSFDVLPSKMVNRIQSWIRLKGDYPLITERFWDKFLTLRISKKAGKLSPKYAFSFTKPNNYLKALIPYQIYEELCGFPRPPV
jgi:hypothetical protein